MASNKKRKEGVIFVINTGKTSAEKNENETQSFLDKEKTLVKQILERKIFIRKGDMTNVICFGANDTVNDEQMDGICLLEPELSDPTWALIQKVLDLRATENSSCWVEGLHVALEFVKRQCTDFIGDIKVIVINNFKEDQNVIEQFNSGTLANEVFGAQVDLLFIGSSDNDEESIAELSLSHLLALEVAQKCKDKCCAGQIDRYLSETRFYKNPPTKPTPWKCKIEIGKISISTETYVKITEPPPFPSWKLTSRSESVGFPPESEVAVKRSTELIDRYKEVTDISDAIKGFKYGGSFIPFSDTELAKSKILGTEKSLIVRGFVKQEEVSLENWFGEGCHIIVPQNDENEKDKFYALVFQMRKLGLVAVVRKVYQANALPKMTVLFPRLEEGEIACLVKIAIPYAEERRVLRPRQDVCLPSKEQQKDIQDYINSMTLPEDDERLKPGSFCNPCKQNKWDNLSHRALNRVPLPPMDKSLMDLISPPESLIEKSEPYLQKLAEWVKPKVLVQKTKDDEKEESVTDNQEAEVKPEPMIRATEEAEKGNKYKEEIFKAIADSTMKTDEDLLDDM